MNYWQGKTVRLRGAEPEDAATFFQWNLESEMGRNLDFVWPPISAALVKKQIEDLSFKKLDDDVFTWIIEDMAGKAVGSISTHHCDRRNGSFGYGLNVAPEHRRRGYASEAVRIIVGYYFQELRYHKAAIQIWSHNQASIAVHEKLGFVREGVLREMIYSGGQYFDILCYGITSAEWAPSAGSF